MIRLSNLVLIESSIKFDTTGINSNQIFVSENKKYYAVTVAGHVANIKSIKHFLPQVLQPENKGEIWRILDKMVVFFQISSELAS